MKAMLLTLLLGLALAAGVVRGAPAPVCVVDLDGAIGPASARFVSLHPGWQTRVLQVIADPSVALILMMICVYGIVFSATPGFGVPGTIGAISLLVGLFALQLLPIDGAGLA